MLLGIFGIKCNKNNSLLETIQYKIKYYNILNVYYYLKSFTLVNESDYSLLKCD